MTDKTGLLKAFYCNESEVYAATNAEHAAELMDDLTGAKPSAGYPEELTDAQLNVQYPAFDENEQPTGEMTSIRQMLAEHGDEPGWLCGSDW
ncbi:hypothetical protein [Xylophilus sp.]|uniref:hypothetical protein n=1 Tax=Xylophilus sp. TaxID=2653893 RepID=UPI0013B89023|nr:hypothetical protein [Xylophilus sp.]KAF1045652.1 MAG: hypothetical protein GAK38_02944 [Xylophilus sp.]